MKKIVLLLVAIFVSSLISALVIADTTKDYETFFGIDAVQDRGKFKIGYVVNNSSAQKAGIKIGYEIIAMDKQKIDKWTMQQVTTYLEAKPTIELVLKDYDNKKNTYKLEKTKLKIYNYKDNTFDIYWKQVFPMIEYAGIDYCLDKYNQMRMYKNFGKKLNQIANARYDLHAQNKILFNKFEAGYDYCKMTNKSSEKALNTCHKQLVDTTKTELAQGMAQQQAFNLQQQLRMQQQSIKAQGLKKNLLRMKLLRDYCQER